MDEKSPLHTCKDAIEKFLIENKLACLFLSEKGRQMLSNFKLVAATDTFLFRDKKKNEIHINFDECKVTRQITVLYFNSKENVFSRILHLDFSPKASLVWVHEDVEDRIIDDVNILLDLLPYEFKQILINFCRSV